MNDKKMFKILCPIQMKDGGTYWMRCGNGFENQDGSFNLHLIAMPVAGLSRNDGIKLQLREYTAEERRERAEKRATYASRPTMGPPGSPPSYAATPPYLGAESTSHAHEPIPF
jgi:hypothetical protein